MDIPFIDKYSAAFGKNNALLLSLTGLTSGEVSAQREWIKTADGRRWLDFGSFGIHLFGHGDVDIIHAISKQIHLMGHSTKILGNQATTIAAESLLTIMPDGYNRIIFSNSGAEAVENAIKVSQVHTKRRKYIALINAFHGKTTGAYSLSYRSGRSQHLVASSLPVEFVAINDINTVKKILSTEEIAAVFVEPILGEGGIVTIPRAFLLAVRKLTLTYDSLFVMDEIQSGLGRTGEILAGVDKETMPDVVLVGKTLGGGMMPVSALIMHQRVSNTCSDPLLMSSSFAGGALASVVVKTVIDKIRQQDFLTKVKQMGNMVLALLRENLKHTNCIVDIRGAGLMIGVEFVSSTISGEVVMNAIKAGLLISFCLTVPEVIRIYPPISTSHDSLIYGIDLFCKIVTDLDNGYIKDARSNNEYDLREY